MSLRMHVKKASMAHMRVFLWGPSVARGDHLWCCRWSGGPSVAAVLSPEGPSTATKMAYYR